jgi:hypothetical protein
LWGDNGVEVSKNDLEIIDYSFDIYKNGMLIVSYMYREPGFIGDYIVAYQFIDQLGNLKHISYDESLLFTSNNRKSKTSVLVDFENGAFFFWMENFSGKSILRSLFIDETGLKIWGKEPVNISNINKSVLSYNVNRFGNSVYLSFQYQGQIKDIHHQLITRNGNLVWGTGGKKISNMNGSQLNPQTAIIDSTIYLTWTNEFRNSKDIFVQKFDMNGKAYWKKEGIPVIKSVGDQFGQKIIHDQKGNLIIAWIDKRADSVYGNIYVQKIDSKGQVIWDSLSVTMGSFHNSHKSYINLLPDGSGGAIVVFKEKRNGKNELFAQKVFETGTFASQILAFTADKVDGKIKLSWYSANESPSVTYNIERTVHADTGLADWNRIGTVEITENRSVNYYEFFDIPDTAGTLYYRIIQNNGNNEESVYDVVKLNYLETAESIVLTQNSPNPFTDSTMISFYLPYDEDITLEFFDSKVEVIKRVPKQKYLAGQHEIIFKSDELEPGIYFYRFKAGNHIEVKKMVVSTR